MAGPSTLPSPDWSALPTRRPATRPPRRVAPIFGPLVIVVMFWVLGHRTIALVVLVLAASIAGASTVSTSFRSHADRATELVSHHVGRFLTIVLLGVAQLAIFTPVALLSRLIRSDPLDITSRTPTESTWLRRQANERDLHERQYGDERYRRLAPTSAPPVGSPRWIRGLIGGLALLLLADVALGSLLVGIDGKTPEQFDGAAFGFDPVAQEALATQPEAGELMSHLRQVGIGNLDPFTGWRFGPGVTYESPFVNIVGGTRTTKTSTADGDRAEVWFFGGSTMYGSGQSDLATIPSALVGLLDDAGIAINATNFGHPAYANWQQVQLLEHELSAGTRPRPDLVVFYDGFNDLTLQTQLGVHDEPTHLFFDQLTAPTVAAESVATAVRTWWDDHSALALAAGRFGELFGDDGPEIQIADVDLPPIDTIDAIAAADAAVAIHRRGVDHVAALADGYGFAVRFFWQPYLYTRAELTRAEQQLVGLPGYDTDVWLPMTDRVRQTLSDPVIDLGDALDDEPTSVYWDFVHTNERGAALIAEAIEPHIVEVLDP